MDMDEDRISNLPDHLIHHILSFLDITYVVRTTILSTRWRYLSASLLFLNLEIHYENIIRPMTEMDFHFMKFVDKVLMTRGIADIMHLSLSYMSPSRERGMGALILLGMSASRWRCAWALIARRMLTPFPSLPFPRPLEFPSYYDDNYLYASNEDNDDNFRGVFSPRVRSWIFSAVQRNVQEIDLGINNVAYGKVNLPECVFASTSLKVLKLRVNDYPVDEYPTYCPTFLIPNSLQLTGLQTLHLESITFKEEDLAYKLFSSCPILESLALVHCGLSYLCDLIISAPKLKYLVMKDCWKNVKPSCRIKIHAPNLVLLKYEDDIVGRCHIESCSDLDNASINVKVAENAYRAEYAVCDTKEEYDERMISCFRAICSVKSLTLSASLLEFLLRPPALVERLPMQFGNLRYLRLKTWLSRDSINGIMNLLNISPNIETLCLDICEKTCLEDKMDVYDEKKPKLLSIYLLHHLKVVEMQNFSGCNKEFKFLEILLTASLVLERLVLFSSNIEPPEREIRLTEFTKRLLTLPRASSSTEILLV